MAKGVQGLILDDGKVLLVKRADFPVWTLPGGHIEKGETEERAVGREVEEEIGFKVKIVKEIGVYAVKYWKPAGVTKVFLCKIISKVSTPQESEVRKVNFFSPKKLPFLLLPYLKIRIADGLK